MSMCLGITIYAKKMGGVNNALELSYNLILKESKLKLLLFSIINTCHSPLEELGS